MKTILIIEDEPQTRQNLATILEMEGYRPITAADGAAGIAAVERELPDLVLCDVSMPVMDGHAVLAALRNHPRFVHLPFIFLTAKSDRRDWRQGMNLGADDYLVKPATATELLSTVEARFALCHAREAVAREVPFKPDFSSTAPLERDGLTPREAEVALWVAQGKSNPDVAAIIGATEATVKKHLQNVFLKMGVENRNALMLRVLERLSRR